MVDLDRREEALLPASFLVAGWSEGGLRTVFDWSNFCCRRIERWHLKPWGRKGRAVLKAAMDEIASTGGYDAWLRCDYCKNEYSIYAGDGRDATFNDAQIDQMLDHYRTVSWICETCKKAGAGDQ